MGVLHEAVALLASALGTVPIHGASVTQGVPAHDGVSLYGGPTVGASASWESRAWTFAYGANMGKAKLERAGIHPEATKPGQLEGHRLVFDGKLNDGSSEPAYANLDPSNATDSGLAPVQGVLHYVTQKELEALDKSEAGLYQRVLLPVHAQVAGHSASIPAWTYVGLKYQVPGAPPVVEHAPSGRYARLVVCGAEQEHLPTTYTQALRRHLEQLGAPPVSCRGPLEPRLRGLWSFLQGPGVEAAELRRGG
mmetsp:Transcript_56611/g.165546  ORF Transcript_56611/g.165546 Transcript_56611/m.165546 type:complete len:251 (+) Transcript_56611:86-838(+)